MKYMLFVYGTPWGAQSRAQSDAGAAFERYLQESGELVAASGMADRCEARVVHATPGPPTVTTPPQRAGAAPPTGWFVVDCESRARAVELAARYPESAGGVDVWPLLEKSGREMGI